jgi:hypothetical protein
VLKNAVSLNLTKSLLVVLGCILQLSSYKWRVMGASHTAACVLQFVFIVVFDTNVSAACENAYVYNCKTAELRWMLRLHGTANVMCSSFAKCVDRHVISRDVCAWRITCRINSEERHH